MRAKRRFSNRSATVHQQLSNHLNSAEIEGDFQMNRKPFPFEKLEVWQDARVLVASVYQQTRSFPKTEMFNLVSQLNRAAVSVASNLAEGSVRGSLKDQAHFSNLAYGSLMEGACQIILSGDLGFIPAENAEPLLGTMQDLSVRIHNLRESQLRRASAS